jgi:hypothetical protein
VEDSRWDDRKGQADRESRLAGEVPQH